MHNKSISKDIDTVSLLVSRKGYIAEICYLVLLDITNVNLPAKVLLKYILFGPLSKF